MRDVKGTAMPVPAADATTDERSNVPVCALEADGASSAERLTWSQICGLPGRSI